MRASLVVFLLLLLTAVSGWSLWSVSGIDTPVPGSTPTSPGSDAPIATQPGEAAAPTEPTPTSAPDRRSVPTADRARRAALRGRLLQGGAALAGVTLQLCRDSRLRAVEIARTHTDEHGAFSFPAQAERCWLTCDAPTVPRDWHSHWLRASEQGLDVGDVHVPKPAVVEGRIRDRRGLQVAGARVWIEANDRVRVGYVPGSATDWFDVRADDNGRFRIERVRPGGAKVVVQAPGFARTRKPFSVEAGATATVDVEVGKGLTLEGIVLDWRGRALPGAIVACTTNELETVTDGIGRFVMPLVPRGSSLTVSAEGHIEHRLSRVNRANEVERVQLLRAATLTGVVHGTYGKPGFVTIEPAGRPAAGASPVQPYSLLLLRDLDLLRNGRFEVEGLSTSDFTVSVRVPGVGRAGPARVEVRDDTEIELTLTPHHPVLVHVRDADGAPIADARILVNDKVARYPAIFRADDPELLEKLLDRSYAAVGTPPLPVVDGTAELGHPPGEPVGFVVRAKGYLDQARLFAAGEVPDEVEIVLGQAGSVRGIVRGNAAPGCHRSVKLWPAELAEPPAEGKALSMAVDASGAFSAHSVAPGSYRAALSRSGGARADKDSSPGAVPLIDEGADLREACAVRVRAGHVTQIELQDPALGALRGRVLARGVPVAGAAVAATRLGRDGEVAEELRWFVASDWDNELRLGLAPGQLSADDGSFRMLYRDAGTVELRVRHADGHATSAPLLVQLPPPGNDVVRDVSLPLGEIHGRFAIEDLPKQKQARLQITLFPLRRAGDDPYLDPGDFAMPLSWKCAHIEDSSDGRFAFRFLPDGTWVVRVHERFSRTTYRQQTVEVHGDTVDLGDVTKLDEAGATLRWRWLDNGITPRKVSGVWLWQEHAGEQQAIWVATLPAKNGVVACPGIAAGRYTVVPLHGYDYGGAVGAGYGLRGDAIAAPVRVAIRTDGSTQPATLEFTALPAK